MAAAKGSIRVELDDGRGFSLAPADWIGEGGEGAVYKKGDLAIKIVEDRGALAKKEPKLRIFKSISHPLLATPSHLAYDGAGALVGYAMRMVEGLPLARLMAPSWRAANGYGEAKLEALGKSMAAAVGALHKAGCWGGDLNEFNWRVQGESAVLIDCDSWGCPGHPVSAMMPSIADPRAAGRYEARSDWYALAVLLFSLFAGIHPFRGGLAGFGPKDMNERMRQGASMLRPGASWPSSVPGPDGLPKGIRAWLLATLEGASREPPPAQDWSKERAATRKSARSMAAGDFPAPFERWLAPGLALLADGSAFDAERRESFSPPSERASRWIDPANGEGFWVWQDGASLRGASMGGSAAFDAALPAGAELRFWGGEAFALRPGAWSAYSVRRLGASGPRATPCAQGVLGSSVDVLDGCAALASFGAHALARPIGGGRGAATIPLKAPRAGARLVFASCAGPYELVDWALPGGARQVDVAKKGAPLASLPGPLDWACPLSEDSALAQVDGKAWLVTASGAAEMSGWAPSQAAPSAWRGSLWVARPGGAELKAYPLSKLLALAPAP